MPVYRKILRGFMYTHKGLDIRMNKGDTVRQHLTGLYGMPNTTGAVLGTWSSFVIITGWKPIMPTFQRSR